MKNLNILSPVLLILISVCFFPSYLYGVQDRYKIVIEESYYTVAYENEEEFLNIYREKIFPFWHEMKKRGIIQEDIRMYSQRIHPHKPQWTFKTVVRFTNYTAIDKWLEERDEVIEKLFPGQGGYKAIRGKISAITTDHWDDFVRELPLE